MNLLVRKNLSITIKMRKRKIQLRIQEIIFTALVSSIRRDGKKEQVVLGETDGKYDGNAFGIFSKWRWAF